MELEMALGILSKNIFIIIATFAMMSVASLLTMVIVLGLLRAGKWLAVRIKHEWNRPESDILAERIFKTEEEIQAAKLARIKGKGGV